MAEREPKIDVRIEAADDGYDVVFAYTIPGMFNKSREEHENMAAAASAATRDLVDELFQDRGRRRLRRPTKANAVRCVGAIYAAISSELDAWEKGFDNKP